MSKETGGPAFPGTQYANYAKGVQPSGFSQGMTLRDYFASDAMRGMMDGHWPTSESDRKSISFLAYQMADAMLKARQA